MVEHSFFNSFTEVSLLFVPIDPPPELRDGIYEIIIWNRDSVGSQSREHFGLVVTFRDVKVKK